MQAMDTNRSAISNTSLEGRPETNLAWQECRRWIEVRTRCGGRRVFFLFQGLLAIERWVCSRVARSRTLA